MGFLRRLPAWSGSLAACVCRSVVCCLLLVPAAAHANGDGAAVASRLEQLLKTHDRILAFRSQAEAARHGLLAAWGEWLPHLEATGSLTRESVRTTQTNVDDTDLDRDEIRLRASQTLFDVAAYHGVNRARALRGQSDQALEATRQRLLFEGLRAWLACLRARDRLGYAQRSVEHIKKQTGIEQSLVDRGAGLSSDVLQAKQQLAGAEALRRRVEGELANAKARFRALFGQEPDDAALAAMPRPVLVENKLPLTLEEAVARAMAANPELLAAAQAREAAAEEIGQTAGAMLPRLEVYGEVLRRRNDDGVEADRVNYNVGLDLRWRIFNGGTDIANTRKAMALRDQATHQAADLRRSVEEDVRVAWQTWLTTKENAGQLKTQADLLQEFLVLARKERMLGTRSLLDVLNAEVQSINAIGEAVAADYDTQLATCNVLLSQGALSPALFGVAGGVAGAN